MPLPDAHNARPIGSRDQYIRDLQRVRRRLLFGGGGLISVLVLLAAMITLMAGVQDFHARQHRAFMAAQSTADFFLLQRDRAYAGAINSNDAMWAEQRQLLEMKGQRFLQSFQQRDGEVLVTAGGPTAVPWLVLALPGHELPAHELAAYLGMIELYSAYTATTVTSLESGEELALYAYEPKGRLIAFAGMRDETQLLQTLRVTSREQAFARLLKEEAGVRQSVPLPGPVQSATAGHRLLSRYGINPLNDRPSLVGVLTMAEGRVPYFRRVSFEPVDSIAARLQAGQHGDFLIIANDGTVVLRSGGIDAADGAALARWVKSQSGDLGQRSLVEGRFVVGGPLQGVDWCLVHVYGWHDLWRDQWQDMLWKMLIALSILSALWYVLLRMDHRLFAPALADARRITESEALSRIIIETSPVGLALVSMANGQPLLQNGLARGLAYSADEAGEPVPALYRQLAHWAKPEEDSQHLQFQWPETAATGIAQRQLEVGLARATYNGQPVWVCALHDVTSQVELEENLRHARQDSEAARHAAEAASRAKTAFVANMSHEIRTPLNGVLGHLELLARASLPIEQRERVDRIRHSADALMSIISDVLDFSKIEAGQLDIESTQFALRPLIERCALLFAPSAQQKGLKLLHSLDAATGLECVADAHRISQILNNLVSNAIKFTESGRVLVQASLRQGNEADAGQLLIRVVDSGIGISEAQASQLFQPFQQADASVSRRYGGSGLGLALCSELATAMGGQISLESTPGVGSVFALTLPVETTEVEEASADALAGQAVTLLSATAEWRNEMTRLLTGWGAWVEAIERPSSLATAAAGAVLLIVGDDAAWDPAELQHLASLHGRVVHAHAAGPLSVEPDGQRTVVTIYSSEVLLHALAGLIERRKTIDGGSRRPQVQAATAGALLLVEDNAINRELIQQQLDELGYTVEVAENGQLALSVWRSNAFAAVLTDINMPVMNGYQLARALRDRGETLPILAITATALASERQRCREAGIDDLLLKPLTLKRLQEALQIYLAGPVATVPTPGEMPAEPEGAVMKRLLPEKVRRVFVESARNDLRALHEARHKRDDAALLDCIHSLKGALLMMGERLLGQRASEIEHELRKGQRPADAALDGLVSDLQVLANQYESSLREQNRDVR